MTKLRVQRRQYSLHDLQRPANQLGDRIGQRSLNTHYRSTWCNINFRPPLQPSLTRNFAYRSTSRQNRPLRPHNLFASIQRSYNPIRHVNAVTRNLNRALQKVIQINVRNRPKAIYSLRPTPRSRTRHTSLSNVYPSILDLYTSKLMNKSVLYRRRRHLNNVRPLKRNLLTLSRPRTSRDTHNHNRMHSIQPAHLTHLRGVLIDLCDRLFNSRFKLNIRTLQRSSLTNNPMRQRRIRNRP